MLLLYHTKERWYIGRMQEWPWWFRMGGQGRSGQGVLEGARECNAKPVVAPGG